MGALAPVGWRVPSWRGVRGSASPETSGPVGHVQFKSCCFSQWVGTGVPVTGSWARVGIGLRSVPPMQDEKDLGRKQPSQLSVRVHKSQGQKLEELGHRCVLCICLLPVSICPPSPQASLCHTALRSRQQGEGLSGSSDWMWVGMGVDTTPCRFGHVSSHRAERTEQGTSVTCHVLHSASGLTCTTQCICRWPPHETPGLAPVCEPVRDTHPGQGVREIARDQRGWGRLRAVCAGARGTEEDTGKGGRGIAEGGQMQRVLSAHSGKCHLRVQGHRSGHPWERWTGRSEDEPEDCVWRIYCSDTGRRCPPAAGGPCRRGRHGGGGERPHPPSRWSSSATLGDPRGGPASGGEGSCWAESRPSRERQR